jgi:hypothetical protein
MNWPSLKLPPINLWSFPWFKKPECKHTHWLKQDSHKIEICYDCGKERPITNHWPSHQR